MGLEPTAYRLTAGCSAIELPRNNLNSETMNLIEMALKYAAYNVTYLGGLMIIVSISFLIAFEDEYLQ